MLNALLGEANLVWILNILGQDNHIFIKMPQIGNKKITLSYSLKFNDIHINCNNKLLLTLTVKAFNIYLYFVILTKIIFSNLYLLCG